MFKRQLLHTEQHHTQPIQQDALSKFLQQNNQMHHQNKQQHNQMMHQHQPQHVNNVHQQPHHPFMMHDEQHQSDVNILMREMANGLISQHPQVVHYFIIM